MKFITQKIVKLTSLLLIPTLITGNTTQLLAEVPHSAKILNIVGANSMDVRRKDGQLGPVSLETVLRILDRLNIPYISGNIFASLEFFNKTNQSMGLRIQASVKNKLKTSYYFPCFVDTKDVFIIEWTNPKTRVRGCEKGIKVRSTAKNKAILPHDNPSTMVASYPLIGQSRIQRMQYCTVANGKGESWLGFSSSSRVNPCQKPLKKCEASQDTNCQVLTLDSWLTNTREYTGVIACKDQKKFILTGLGNNLKKQVLNEWNNVKKNGVMGCSLQVFGKEDTIVEPSNEELNKVEINNNNYCLNFFVYEGIVNITSSKHPDGRSYSKGEKYQYCPNDQTESKFTFKPQQESIDMQVFLAKDRGYEFCNRQQASGGSQGDERTIQMTSTEGIININYTMYGIPDQLKVIYENRELINTGMVSGSDKISVPFSGNSGQVTVKLIGNTNTGTKWDYTLFCPK